MKVTYDKTAKALYIYFKKIVVAKTVQLNDRTVVDFDINGNIVGVEILDVSLSPQSFKTNFAEALCV